MKPHALTQEPVADAIMARTQYIESKNRKMAYRSIGEGKPMILCNRFRGNLDSWDPAFLDALAKKYKVIIFDWTGFGSSTGLPPTTMLEFATDVKDLMEALHLKKVTIVGWSFGGMVTQTVITQFPDLISHAILICTNPPGKNAYPMEEIFYETAWKPYNDLEDEIVLFFEPASQMSREAAKRSHKRMAKRTVDVDVRIEENLWNNYSKGVKEYIEDPYQAREKLSTTHIPILVITADHEICFPPQNWYALTRYLPTAQIMVFPQAGHGVHHQYPKLTAKYIANFIKHTK